MTRFTTHKAWLLLGVGVALIILLVCAFAFLNPRLTTLAESDKFRAEMEKETAKGLHFPNALFESIKRSGTWTAESAGFRADGGRKALHSLQAPLACHPPSA